MEKNIHLKMTLSSSEIYFSFKVDNKRQCGVWMSLSRIICMKTNQVEQKKVKTVREVPIKIIKP